MASARGRVRLAILISGRGSNMQALVEAAGARDYPAEVVLVVANRPAAGLDWAADRGIATALVDHRAFPSREAFDAAIDALLRVHAVELVALAGFMRVLTAGFVRAWEGRILNIHPSLLPKYPGLDTHARALAAGDAVSGCTVHLVKAEVDEGPVLAQAEVPIRAGDTPVELAARVLAAEHQLYPEALADFARGLRQADSRTY